MSVLLKLLKTTALTNSLICVPHRAIRTTQALLLNQKFFKWRSSQNREQKYMEDDRVPASSELIYKSPMDSYITWTMHTSSITTSLVSIAALYHYTCGNEPIYEGILNTLVIHSEDIYYFALGFLAINAVIRLVVSICPRRIYKDNGKYLAVFQPQLPGSVSQHSFNQGDVKAVTYLLNPWNNAAHKLGTRTALIFEDFFKTPSEYHKMVVEKDHNL